MNWKPQIENPPAPVSPSQPSTAHTPTPWHVNHDRPNDETSQLSISNGDARIIANIVTRDSTHGWEGGSANAAFIVEAVNNYAALRAKVDALTAALRKAGEILERRASGYEARGNHIFNGRILADELRGNAREIAALAVYSQHRDGEAGL